MQLTPRLFVQPTKENNKSKKPKKGNKAKTTKKSAISKPQPVTPLEMHVPEGPEVPLQAGVSI